MGSTFSQITTNIAIINTDPTADTHAARKGWVDAQLAALGTVHAPVTIASTAQSVILSLSGQQITAQVNLLATGFVSGQGQLAQDGSGKVYVVLGATASTAAAGNHTHSAATTLVAGFLSTADKAKLDGIASGATAIALAGSGSAGTAAHSDHTHDVVTDMAAGFMSSAMLAALEAASPGAGPGAVVGIVKSNGADVFSAAVDGTDFLGPGAIGVTVQAHTVALDAIALLNLSGTGDIALTGYVVVTANAAAAVAQAAAQAYADSLVVGLLDDRGNYDASGNVFPSSGGSGTAGAVKKGDLWTVSVAGTLGGTAVTAGDVVRAIADTPGQTAGNWSVTENNFGYVALNQALASGKIYVGNGSGVGTAVTVSGDWTISNAGVATLANSGATAASYGSASQVATFTIDAKGRVTAAANVTITPSAIGLGNVTNTSDANKPVSTAQQTALDLKVTGREITLAADATVASLTVAANEYVRLTGPGGKVLTITTALTVAAGGILDIGDNHMVLKVATGKTEALMQAMVRDGRLRCRPNKLRTIGFIDNADFGFGAGDCALMPTITFAADDLLVGYAKWGDTNFDEVINGDDSDSIAYGRVNGTEGLKWIYGNFRLIESGVSVIDYIIYLSAFFGSKDPLNLVQSLYSTDFSSLTTSGEKLQFRNNIGAVGREGAQTITTTGGAVPLTLQSASGTTQLSWNNGAGEQGFIQDGIIVTTIGMAFAPDFSIMMAPDGGGGVYLTNGVATFLMTDTGVIEFSGNYFNFTLPAKFSPDVIVNHSRMDAAVGGVLKDFITDAGNSGTSETDLYSITLSASTLDADKEKIEAQYAGVFVFSATATRRLRIYFAGTSIFDTGALTLAAAGTWDIYLTLIRTGSTTGRAIVSMTVQGAPLAAYTAETDLTGLDFTTTNILKITGTAAATGAATNDIVAKIGGVKWMPAGAN
jgi:hypothetical protein